MAVTFKPVRDDENPQDLPFPPEAQSLLMRSAIAAAVASKRLAEEKGVFRLTPSEWAELEAGARS